MSEIHASANQAHDSFEKTVYSLAVSNCLSKNKISSTPNKGRRTEFKVIFFTRG
jgi:hypothetical protein